MKIHSHLLLLVLGTLLPMVLFGVAATVLIAQREKAVFQRGATERTLALLTAVDTELKSHFKSLRTLATSRHLETGDFEAFHDTATRTLSSQPYWRRVDLALPSGERLLDTGTPSRTELPPVVDRASFEAAQEAGTPTTGHLFLEGREHLFAVRLPVKQDGETRFVLSALVEPEAIAGILAAQRLPPSWFGVVLDANHRILGRTVDGEGTLGQLGSQSLRAALERAPEGWFRGATIEGTDVYTPYNRSPFSGWTVAIGIPAAAVEAGTQRVAEMLALGVLAAVAIAGVMAVASGRRITGPIGSLAALARAIAKRAPTVEPEPSGVQEVHEVSRALVDAARAVRERESALLDAHRAKDEFLAMLAHELRNPLAPIRNALQLVRSSGDARLEQPVAMMERQVDHMVRLVDDLLDVSRLSRGKIELRRSRIELRSVLQQALDGARVLCEGKGLELSLTLPTEPLYVDGDATRLVQVVDNLLNNACKFTDSGGHVRLRLEREGNQAVVGVRDDGIGLAEDQLDRIFEMFTQVDSSKGRPQTGLGIGLTLTQRLVEMHGGAVEARSAGPGRGSEFLVRLPLVPGPAAEEPRETADAQAVPGPGRRVLVVDDNQDAADSLAMLLQLGGHEVHTAYDGREALDVAERERPDAILLDIGLPKIDGYEAARAIRSRGWGEHVLLVALTGWGKDEDRRRSREAGFDAHLVKPVDYGELVACLQGSAPPSPRAS